MEKTNRSVLRIILVLLLMTVFSCDLSPSIDIPHLESNGPWLTLHSDNTRSVTISWYSQFDRKTIIYWGKEPQSLSKKIISDDFVNLHHAVFDDLEEDTQYYYSIDDSEIHSFKTTSDSPMNFKITIIGDMQPKSDLTILTNSIISESVSRENPDLVIQLGDITENGGILYSWNEPLKFISSYASSIPFLAVAGNHDYRWDGNSNFREYLPYNYESPHGLNYSKDYYNTHLIFLDCYVFVCS